MTFRVGQKVVCVNVDRWPAEHHRFAYPKLGQVYTVRECFVDVEGDRNIRVAEISNPVGMCITSGVFTEPYFLASRFRPVVERKTDISIFTKMLTGNRVNA